MDIPTSTISSRLEVILPLIQGKTILDIGCADHDSEQSIIEPSWMHKQLYSSAREVLGIDIKKKAVDELRKSGYNIICADIEKCRLDKFFDIIIAGEILEHLGNPQKALENMRSHLSNDGIIIISTPNPFSISQFFRILKRDQVKVRNDHTCWYDPQTLYCLIEKSGLKLLQLYWIKPATKYLFQNTFSFFRSYFSPSFVITAIKN